MEKKNIHFVLACVEFLLAWCAWILFGYASGYITGWQGIFTIKRLFAIRELFANIPYKEIRYLAKQKDPTQYIDCKCTQDDIVFLSFILHPAIRHGIRYLLLALGLFIVIFAGADWTMLYVAALIAIILGILRLLQGIFDIV